jgi:electron transfer flavoprotein beta subunit
MGPASTALHKALVIGATTAVHIVDDSLAGADITVTAAVLSAAVARSAFDLVIADNESTDGRGGVVPAMIAEYLGVPHLTSLDSVDISAAGVDGVRSDDQARCGSVPSSRRSCR